MPSIKIDDSELALPSPETLKLLSDGWDPTNNETAAAAPTIEVIYNALRKTYTHDQLYQLEAEFILQHLCSFWKIDREKVDERFAEKIYGVLAIVLNPLEVTQDLSAFINTCLLANDEATIPGDGELVPSRYIPRMIDAVNAILPDDQDFHDVFWQDNITKFIVACYDAENNRVLDDEIAYMDDIYLNLTHTVSEATRMKTLVTTIRKLGQEIWDEIPWIKNSEELTRPVIEANLDLIGRDLEAKLPSDFKDDQFIMTMLGKYIVNKAYVEFYSQLRDLPKS